MGIVIGREFFVLLASIATSIGCGVDLGETADWVSIDEMAGKMKPQYVDPPRALMAPTDRPLRIATYNIRDGGAEPAQLAAALLANPALANVDVLLIQEAILRPDEVMRIAPLANALGLGYFFAPAREQYGYILGDAILSRYPLSNMAVMQLPLATRKNRRIALAADIAVGDVTLRIVNTHLDTSLNITNRILQLRPAVIDQPTATLVGGDFNTNPYAWAEGAVPIVSESEIVDTDQAPQLDSYMAAIEFENPTAELGNTEVRYGIESRLDAIFSRDVDVMQRGIERSITLSDHWPVWIDVRTRP